MFEFDIKSPHKIKIINVTEARGNFAAILSDQSANYIITKNNKPLRVIVNFEDFQKWENQADPSTQEPEKIVVQPTVMPPPPTEESAEAFEMSRSRKAVSDNPVKGVLADRFEATMKPLTGASEPGTVQAVSWDDFRSLDEPEMPSPEDFPPPSPADKAEKAPEEEAVAAETAQHAIDEAFRAEHAEDLASQVELVEPPADNASAQDEATTEESYYSESDDAPDTFEKIVEHKPSDYGDEDDEDPFAVPENNPENIQNEARTPEEEEYFRRYSKLYETEPKHNYQSILPTGPWDAEAKKQPAVDAHDQRETDENQRLVDAQEPPAATGGQDEDSPTETPEKNLETNPSEQVDNTGVSVQEAKGFAESAAVDSAADVFHKSLENTSDKLPSLQDLLKELEGERLSGEDAKPLEQEEIDEIINRITSD